MPRLLELAQKYGVFDNWLAKLGAFLIAVLLWFASTTERRTTATRGLDVPLEVRGLNDNRVIKDLPKTVRLQIQGQRSELEQIQSSNLEASLNIKNRPDGFFSADVRVDAPSNVTVLSFEPKRVSATLKSVVKQSILVKIASDNPNQISLPATVLAIGTTEQVAQVSFALGLATSNESYLTPVNANGELVDGVRLEPNKVSLR